MIRLADLVVQSLMENFIGEAFMVSGGAAMHINDAIGKNKKLKKIFCHHEQTCVPRERLPKRLPKMLLQLVKPAPLLIFSGCGHLMCHRV